MNNLLRQGRIVELNVQPFFLSFSHLPLVQGMVRKILVSRPLLIQSIMDLFSRFQVFHQTTLWISVIILAIYYVVSLLNFDTKFP